MRKPKDPCDKIKYKYLLLEGTRYKTTFTRKFENRKPWIQPNPMQVTAFIPGLILKVLVEPGQEIKAGQELLVLEAMKMKNQLKAPADGRVKSVMVKEGEKVPKDFLLVELE